MGADYWLNPLNFLIVTAFRLVILALLLRLLLQWANADYYNPISQFLVRFTEPMLRPLRVLLPSSRRIDAPALLLMFVLQVLMYVSVMLLRGQAIPLEWLLPASLAELLVLASLLFTITIFIQIIVSWINPGAHHPGLSLLYQLNAPLLAPARRLLPATSGIDLSPLLVLIGLVIIRMLAYPLTLPVL